MATAGGLSKRVSGTAGLIQPPKQGQRRLVAASKPPKESLQGRALPALRLLPDETACIKAAQPHNSPVLDPGKAAPCVPGLAGSGRSRPGFGKAWLGCGLVVILAGCATGPRENGAPTLNWEREGAMAAPVAPAAPDASEPLIAPLAPAPAVAPAEPSAPTNQPAETWIPLSRWCKANGLAAPCLVGQAPTPAYTLSASSGVFGLRVGSLLAHWDGLEVRLGFAPQMMSGQPCLHSLDLKKTLEPLVMGFGLSFLKTSPTIVIDPGHGGQDSGTKSVLGYRHEKEFTLDWARRLGSMLATNGWQVFLTHNNDTDLSVSNRIAFAEAHKADLFLSLHFNSSAPNDQQVGLETYCLTPTGMPSTITRGYYDDPALSFPNNAFDTQNLQVAVQVHRELLQVNGRHDRGLRRARYLGVLRGQNRPAILVEGGYLSNPHEARLIADPAYRQKLAEAVAKALR